MGRPPYWASGERDTIPPDAAMSSLAGLLVISLLLTPPYVRYHSRVRARDYGTSA